MKLKYIILTIITFLLAVLFILQQGVLISTTATLQNEAVGSNISVEFEPYILNVKGYSSNSLIENISFNLKYSSSKGPIKFDQFNFSLEQDNLVTMYDKSNYSYIPIGVETEDDEEYMINGGGYIFTFELKDYARLGDVITLSSDYFRDLNFTVKNVSKWVNTFYP